jgi:hypothetical protein
LSVNRKATGREHEAEQAEVPSGDYGGEDNGDDRHEPLHDIDPVNHASIRR